VISLVILLSILPARGQSAADKATVWFPTGKVLLHPVESRALTDGLPVTIALSPDGRYAALLHAGYGTQQTRGCQSITIYEFATAKLSDFPDDRLCEDARQSYFLGLVFSVDGHHLYASLGSITDPTGSKPGSTGNAVAVYSFQSGELKPERIVKIPPQPLAEGKRVPKGLFKAPRGTALPYPAGMALLGGGKSDRLLIANNLSDDVVVLDVGSGEIVQRFDLSLNMLVPSAYPYTVVSSKDGRRAWCSLWNASRIAELDLEHETVARWISLREPESPTAPGSHPSALLLSPDEQRLYVALANADAVAAVSTATGKVERWYSTELKDQKYGGTSPLALAQSPDGKRLFVADANLNAVAVFDVSANAGDASQDQAALGFIPTEWYPSALAVRGGELFVATAKGTGTGPNTGLSRIPSARRHRENPYIPTLLYGSLATVDYRKAEQGLADLTRQVEENNRLRSEASTIRFPAGGNPIKHVIYIIKENRTYDQVLGDLEIGNGDRSLTLYGEDITPNEHKLARQFGVLDNFYDSGEVSGDGHIWSNAAITTDYTEKTWPIAYRGKERTYDFDGTLADEVAVDHGIPDIDAPATGYLWANAAHHDLTYRNYGEFVPTEFCVKGSSDHPAAEDEIPPAAGGPCDPRVIRKGEALPSPTGGEPIPSPYPWNIPRMKPAIPAMDELRGHTDARYAPFNVEYPDQLRADEFLAEFDGFVKARGQGKDKELPELIVMHLPNDHTGGTRPGRPTPSANVADNDLALGRIVEAVSHSPYWDDTAIFVLEDDAQDGADHVDAHRSLVLVLSKYAAGSVAHPFVDHDFHTTVSVVRTIETLLGLPPMNLNDGYSPVMAKEFSGAGDQPAFTADPRNRDNGLIYRMNSAKAPGAKKSVRMDFSRPDAANAHLLNAILWRDRKGSARMPAARHTVIPASTRDND
jgi:DNA-binding beta-propeller fold protein YncE